MQNNRYKVIFSERASEMLLKHIRFMANVSISAAKKFKGRNNEGCAGDSQYAKQQSVAYRLIYSQIQIP